MELVALLTPLRPAEYTSDQTRRLEKVCNLLSSTKSSNTNGRLPNAHPRDLLDRFHGIDSSLSWTVLAIIEQLKYGKRTGTKLPSFVQEGCLK